MSNKSFNRNSKQFIYVHTHNESKYCFVCLQVTFITFGASRKQVWALTLTYWVLLMDFFLRMFAFEICELVALRCRCSPLTNLKDILSGCNNYCTYMCNWLTILFQYIFLMLLIFYNTLHCRVFYVFTSTLVLINIING